MFVTAAKTSRALSQMRHDARTRVRNWCHKGGRDKGKGTREKGKRPARK